MINTCAVLLWKTPKHILLKILERPSSWLNRKSIPENVKKPQKNMIFPVNFKCYMKYTTLQLYVPYHDL